MAVTQSAVAKYLTGLPAPRRKEIERVRRVVRKHLPKGYQETVTNGMIVYQVPLRLYSDTYNGHPLMYAALALNKNSLTLHLLPLYVSKPLETRLRNGFKAAGKRLDMGKGCIRFRTAEDLALDAIGGIVASIPMDKFIAIAQARRR